MSTKKKQNIALIMIFVFTMRSIIKTDSIIDSLQNVCTNNYTFSLFNPFYLLLTRNINKKNPFKRQFSFND